jgi:hypothetical protein
MPGARLPHMKKHLVWLLLAVALLVVAGLGFAWFGPVQVGNKKVMLDFLLGRSIEASGSRSIPPTCPSPAGRSRLRPAT